MAYNWMKEEGESKRATNTETGVEPLLSICLSVCLSVCLSLLSQTHAPPQAKASTAGALTTATHFMRSGKCFWSMIAMPYFLFNRWYMYVRPK